MPDAQLSDRPTGVASSGERSERIETRAERESLSRRLMRQGEFFGSAPMFVDVHELRSGLSPDRGTCDTLSGIPFTAAPVQPEHGGIGPPASERTNRP